MVNFKVKLAVILLAVGVVVGLQFVPWRIAENPGVLKAISQLNGQYVNRAAPEFELPDTSGKMHKLSDFRGKVVFVNFWGSFCAPCREEMPSMESLVRQYESQGFEMIAVSFDESSEEIDGFMSQFLPGQRSSMTVLWDPTAETGKRFGTELVPETYIVDRDGRIIARFVNAYDWTRPEVKQLIEALIRSRQTRARWW